MEPKQFPEMWNFFAGEFNQDWNVWHSTWQDVVRSYIDEAQPGAVDRLVEEMEKILGFDETKTRMLLDEYCCFYLPKGTYSKWLNDVYHFLTQEENNS